MRAFLPGRALAFRRAPFSGIRRTFSSAATTLDASSSPEARPHEDQEQHHSTSQDASTTITASNTPTTTPLIYPLPPSAPHHTDLPSFLAHAARTGLAPTSTVYVGTHFEYTACAALARYGLSLRRVGGVADAGIDLLGTWALPPRSATTPATISGGGGTELRVLAQCKAVQRPGPHLVRELEGAFVGAPAGWRGDAVVGLLVAEKPATKGIREALARSRWPMGFVACSRAGKVEQFLWNRRAEEEGLEGLGVAMKYLSGSEGAEGGRELVLTWRGRNLPFVEGKEEGAG